MNALSSATSFAVGRAEFRISFLVNGHLAAEQFLPKLGEDLRVFAVDGKGGDAREG